MRIWRGHKRKPVEEGAAYRHPQAGPVIETAHVLSLCEDSFGIPHVRFMVSYERRERTVHEEGPRLLSLSAFISHYREPTEV